MIFDSMMMVVFWSIFNNFDVFCCDYACATFSKPVCSLTWFISNWYHFLGFFFKLFLILCRPAYRLCFRKYELIFGTLLVQASIGIHPIKSLERTRFFYVRCSSCSFRL